MKTYKLKDLLSEPVRNGLTKPSKVRGNGFKMVNMGELFANPIIRNIKMDRVPLNEKELSNSLLKYEDLLFARQSLTVEGAGKCSIFLADDEPTTFESHLIRVRINKLLANPKYIYYYFKSTNGKNSISSIVTATAAAGIRGSDLIELELKIPDVNNQNSIATILSNIDDKIELNRQTNQTLETIAQALFKEWFVDFNFPGATGEMQESELGEIPKGWSVGKLNNVIELNPKESIKKGAVATYVEMKDLSESSASVKQFNSREFSSGSKFRNNDTLIARITPCLENGKTGFVDFLNENEVGWGSTEFIVLRGKSVSPYFVYCLSRLEKFRQYAIQSMIGSSGRQRVVESILSDYDIVIPPKKLTDLFTKTLDSVFIKIKSNHEQNKTLSHLRDGLLPKLMRGEIPMSEYKKLTAELL